MPLQFVIGDTYADKENGMIQEIAEHLHTNKDKDLEIFYIVPEHMKFESELNVLNRLHQHEYFSDVEFMGMIQLQVFSFNRLAWYLLQDEPLFNQPRLTETGLAMLIQRVITELQDDLTIYRGEVVRKGFISKLVTLFKEARQGNITSIDLIELLDSAEDNQSPKTKNLYLKLHDIQLIYHAYNHALLDKYVDSEDVLEALTNEFQSHKRSNTFIYINHFQEFTAQEQQVLKAMMTNTEQVTIGLTLDRPYVYELPEKNELYYTTGKTYNKLYQMAKENHVPLMVDQQLQETIPAHEGLLEVKEYWKASQKNMRGFKAEEGVDVADAVEVWRGDSKQAEVFHTATKIVDLVKNKHYRYQDILILTRQTSDYRGIIEPVFERNDISLFVDENKTMSDHPFVEWITSLLNVYTYNWRYEDVMRLLRSELILPLTDGRIPSDDEERLAYLEDRTEEFRQAVDVTENVVLAQGYRGKQWTQEEDWEYIGFVLDDETANQSDEDLQIQETANSVRRYLKEILVPLFKRLDRVKTNEEVAATLYQFIEKNNIPQLLLFWRDQAIQEEDLETGREHEQIWETFITLLDEFVEVLGDTAWAYDQLLDLLTVGFENATYSQVPPAIDQVIFTNMEKMQPRKAKVVFVMGLTDTNLPLQIENKSLLTDEDRSFIDAQLPDEKFLNANPEDRIAGEPYIAYLALTQASEKLYLTYPTSSEDNGELKLSPYIDRIRSAFDLNISPKATDAANLSKSNKEDYLSYIGSPRETLGQIVGILREHQLRDEQPDSFWLQIYRILKKDYTEDKVMRKIADSLHYSNIPVKLKPALAESLYGKNLYLSVSQLERFYLDPFSHFLEYGLRLQERKILEFSPLETGTFYHDTLDSLFKYMIDKNIDMRSLTEEETLHHVSNILEKLYGKGRYKILDQSNRMNFTKYQLTETMRKVAKILQRQSKETTLRPTASEVLFGRLGAQKGVPGLTYALNNGSTLNIRGKIDRVDTTTIANDTYLSVVDYKSSAHKIDYQQIYYGLSLQLLTYLTVALKESHHLIQAEVKPAGAFYYQVKNPYLTVKKPMTEEEIKNEVFKEYKMDGLIIDDKDLVAELAKHLEEKENSSLYALYKNKDGVVGGANATGKTNLVTLEEIKLLMDYTQQMIIQAGNQILQGDTRIRPFEDQMLRKRTPSISGPYQAISQFDVLLPGNQYRYMKDIKKNDILNQAKNDEESRGEEE